MIGGGDPVVPGDHRAFWSYVRADDEAEGGRISRLRARLAQRVELLTGAAFPIFLDHDDIAWGQRWEPALEAALRDSMVFIPILTPRYFTREACRTELRTFIRLAHDAGREAAVLPIHHIDVPALRPGTTSEDPLVEQVKELQIVDWRQLALEDEESAAHRQAVQALALRLVARRGAAAAGTDPHPPPPAPTGPTDLLAVVEEARLGIEGEVRLVQALSAELDGVIRAGSPAPGFAARTARAQRLAREVEDLSVDIVAVATELHRMASAVDPEIAGLARTAAGTDPPTSAFDLWANVATTAREAEEALSALEELSLATADGTVFSPEMRGPNERLRAGAERASLARATIRSWRSLVATSTDAP